MLKIDSKWELSPLQEDRNMCPVDYFEISCQDHPWWIAHVRASDQSGQPYAEAIVSAVNNTYGIGISPEKVPELLKTLETIAAWPGNLPDERYTSKTGPNDAALRGQLVVAMRSLAKSAIEQSKL